MITGRRWYYSWDAETVLQKNITSNSFAVQQVRAWLRRPRWLDPCRYNIITRKIIIGLDYIIVYIIE